MMEHEKAGPPPFWSYAFRPFFLLNAVFAVAAVALWIMALHGAGPATLPDDAVAWHAHEMIVGFAMAAVAGFVLTAVATWTGRPPVSGTGLALLVAAWAAGRLAMLFAGVLPAWVTAVADSIFPLLLTLAIAREVIAAGNRRNLPIVGVIAILSGLNIAYHAGATRVTLYLLIHAILFLITVIAGRIVPNFTANWLRARGHEHLPVNHAWLNLATVVGTVATGIASAVAPTSVMTGILALFTAAAHAARLAGWRGFATTPEPLLFVLHVAYAWLPVGYALTGCAVLGWWFPPTAALHALTMGAIGSMILAVTTRVALAHTGRALHAARTTVVAYVVLALAVVARVLGFVTGDAYLDSVDVSALGWMLAFGIFAWVYWPIMIGPRVD
jgi:uncharacterized protein involved in response to NO